MHKFAHGIRQREGKVTARYIQVLQEDSKTLTNILYNDLKYDKAREFWAAENQKYFWKFATKETFKELGKSNHEMRQYESAPGLWILDDEITGIVWMIYSDLHHKNAWKGTSYELSFKHAKKPISCTDLIDALDRLIRFLRLE